MRIYDSHIRSPLPQSEISEDDILQWLKLAQRCELNVFYDYNAIIARLCVELLQEKGLKQENN